MSCNSPHGYSGVGVGNHTFQVRAYDDAGNADTASYPWTIQAPPDPPVNTSAPFITGTPQEGHTLTANKGSWTGANNNYGYDWTRCDASGGNCVNAGSSGTSYSLDASDVGSTIRVVVTATNGDGSQAAESAPSPIIEAAPDPPVNTQPPGITGTAREGGTLTATPGTWVGSTPMTTTYRWRHCNASGGSCVNISGSTADGATYVLKQADVDFTMRVQVTVSNLAGSASQESAATEVVVDDTAPPLTITGGPRPYTRTRTARLTFASEAGATFKCQIDSAPMTACTSPKIYTGLAARRHTVTVVATDRKNNATTATRSWTVDLTPPGRVRNAVARSGNRVVSLRWGLPRVSDLKRVTVIRIGGRAGSATKVRLYSGKGTRLTDRSVRNGRRYVYRIWTFDRAGNRNFVSRSARPRDPLIAPRNGARVSRTPLLRWVRNERATYYNVQLWFRTRSGAYKKVFSSWPVLPRKQVPSTWRYQGRKHTLVRGRYIWFVWPGFGLRSENRYGRMLGQHTFIRG